MATKNIALIEAALRIGRSYNATQRLVLTGELAGGRNERRQWFVTGESVERFIAEEKASKARGRGEPARASI